MRLLSATSLSLFEWTADNQLMYAVDSNTTFRYRLYDPTTATTDELERWLSPSRTRANRDERHFVSVAPNGAMALYQVPKPAQESSDLWLSLSGLDTRLLSLPNCHISYTWSNDARFVVIRTHFGQGCSEEVVILDTFSHQITSVMVTHIYEKRRLYAFSPQDRLLLYMQEGALYLYDLENATTAPLELDDPESLMWVQILAARQLLVGRNYPNAHGKRWLIEVFDLDTMTANPASYSEEVAADSAALLGTDAALSPDGQWLAFALKRQEYFDSDLWLLRVAE